MGSVRGSVAPVSKQVSILSQVHGNVAVVRGWHELAAHEAHLAYTFSPCLHMQIEPSSAAVCTSHSGPLLQAERARKDYHVHAQKDSARLSAYAAYAGCRQAQYTA